MPRTNTETILTKLNLVIKEISSLEYSSKIPLCKETHKVKGPCLQTLDPSQVMSISKIILKCMYIPVHINGKE